MTIRVTPGGPRAFIADMERTREAGLLEPDARIESMAGALVPMSPRDPSPRRRDT